MLKHASDRLDAGSQDCFDRTFGCKGAECASPRGFAWTKAFPRLSNVYLGSLDIDFVSEMHGTSHDSDRQQGLVE